MHNTLRTDIHVRAGCHLPVLGYAQGIKPLPIVGFGVIRNHHSIGNHNPWRFGMRREKSHRMTGIHHQRLVVGHLAEVFHRKAILRPILKNSPISAISNQLVRMLRHRRIEVVLNHQHDSRRLLRTGWVLINGACIHGVARPEAVHVNSAVFAQLLYKLGCQHRMMPGMKVPQCVAQGQLFFSFAEDVFSPRGVTNRWVDGSRRWKFVGNSLLYLLLKQVNIVSYHDSFLSNFPVFTL